MRFTIQQFRARFPDDTACLEELMQLRYGSLKVCPNPDCEKETKFHRVSTRRCYACQWCGHQIYPTEGTVFEKTTTPLVNWFYVIYLMTATRSGVAAKEVERQLGVTYKTAWRMCHQIRKLMADDGSVKLDGHVEVDETYIGGKRPGVRGRGAKGKSVVLGMVERDGRVKAMKVENVKRATILPHIKQHVAEGCQVSTDELPTYNVLNTEGYQHACVRHAARQFVNGSAHTNTIEGFWSRLKLSVRGTHVWVSGKYLNRYVDEFAFRYSNRKEPALMFDAVLAGLKPSV